MAGGSGNEKKKIKRSNVMATVWRELKVSLHIGIRQRKYSKIMLRFKMQVMGVWCCLIEVRDTFLVLWDIH